MTRSSTKVSPWGLSVVSTVAEKDGGVASRRRTVETLTMMRFNGLKNWSRWRKNGKAQCTTLYVRDSNKKKLRKSFDRSWVYFLAQFWGFEGYKHGPRTNTRWMTSPYRSFENLDCSSKSSAFVASTWLVRRSLMLQGRRDMRQETKSTEISKRPIRRKGWLTKEFHNFLYERWLYAETSKQSCSHLCLTSWIGVVGNLLF
jgi:hypothetical protein